MKAIKIYNEKINGKKKNKDHIDNLDADDSILIDSQPNV